MQVMLVEDDMMFRYGIRSFIDWNTYGFHLHAEAVNGEHAMQLMKEALPDIIVTDISMPEMNGIELIKHVKKDYPHIKLIVLSSYDDFEFVKDALKSGAEDYLLKFELKEDKFIEVLENVRSKINSERENKNTQEFLMSNLSAISEGVIKKILSGEIHDGSEIKKKFKNLGLNLAASKFQIMSIEADEFKSKTPSLSESTASIIQSCISDYAEGLSVSLSEGKFVAFVSFENEIRESRMRIIAVETANQIRLKVSQQLQLTVSIGISGLCNRLQDIPEYFRQSQSALRNKVYEGRNKVFFHEQLPVRENKATDFNICTVEKLVALLKEGAYEKLLDEIRFIFDRICKERPEYDEMRKILLELYSFLYLICKDMNIDIAEITDKEDIFAEIPDLVEDVGESRDFFIHCFSRLIEKSRLKKGSHKWEVQKSMEYIAANFTRDISLGQIAEELKISPNYLCSIFKKETGMRIVEYINKLRIDEARNLLKHTNLKVFEICNKVGFNNTSYFCTVFKELTGTTVSDYRKN